MFSSLEQSEQVIIYSFWFMCTYIILDGIEGCMRIYCTRHDDIHRAGTARWISSWLVQYILIQPEIKTSNIIIII